jgi:hypothetical protein
MGAAASISLLLQRQCTAGWRWPGDLRRPSADEILAAMRSDLGPRGLDRDPLRLRLVSTTARGDPPWVIFAARGRPGLLAQAWWWWLPSPPKAVGQAGSDGSWIPLLAPAASWGDIVAGENRADSGHGGRWRRLRRYLDEGIVKQLSSTCSCRSGRNPKITGSDDGGAAVSCSLLGASFVERRRMEEA